MLLIALLTTLTFLLTVAQAVNNWPCIGLKCPPSKKNRAGKECLKKDGFECDNPDCTIDNDPACKRGAIQFKCDVKNQKCADYVAPSTAKVGDACTNNSNCSAALVCVNKQCVTGRAGSFKDCVTDSNCSDFKGEVCEDGVCLLPTASNKYTDPSVPSTFNPDPKMAKGPCDNTTGCPTPDLVCFQGNCYPRSLLLVTQSAVITIPVIVPGTKPQADPKPTKKKGRGRKKGAHADTVFRDDGLMMPPGPEYTGCRDAKLEDGTTACPDNKDLCKDKIYQDLMEEQCPMTCGLCGVSRSQSRRRKSNRRRGKREIIDNSINRDQHIKN